MSFFDAPSYRDHEQVVFCRDAGSGLSAIIAVHDTTLGPGVGGCRMWPYRDDVHALDDALRLSAAMTRKSALAGLPLGGGKSVLIGDPKRDKSPSLLRAFGRAIEGLGGRYVAAEDVGIGVADVETIGRETRYVAGVTRGCAASGDPSPLTAHGVFVGLCAAVRHRLGRDELAGLTVAVQGVGAVGYHLCQHLHAAGARILVADVCESVLRRARDAFGASVLPPHEIAAAEADVFAPCALGAVLDDSSVPALRCKIVAGSANNQLADPRHGEALRRRGILYAPDYAINAGGIINVAAELAGEHDPDTVLEQVERIGPRLTRIFRAADEKGWPTERVADALADARLAAARRP